MMPESLTLLANHLWQSTLFAGASGLLALTLRNNQARVRYWVWVAGSFKLLIPFSVLMWLGGQIEWCKAPAIQRSAVPVVIEQISQPFAATADPSQILAGAPNATNPAPPILFAIWACGFLGISLSWWIRWLRIKSAVRSGAPVRLKIPIRAVSSPALPEPGLFGVVRPVLLLPEGIFERLTPEQLNTVIAHELCHVRHRDNLIAVIQMFVETVFWFHPLVWWAGRRMVEEREQACDEEVLRLGSEPRVYAQSILTVCELYLESPPPCVTGVTGSNLEKRIERIMNHRAMSKLNLAKKAILAASGIAALALPVAIGVLDAPFVHAQSILLGAPGHPRPAFEVASVRPVNRATMHRDHEGRQLDRERFVDRTDLLTYIVRAYIRGGSCGMKVALGQDCPLIVGDLPIWSRQDRFEIQARLPPDSPSYSARQLQNQDTPQLNLMLQVLLEDRFHLKLHRETREISVYALTVGKNGPKLKQTPPKGELLKTADGSLTEHHGMSGALNVPSPDGSQRRRLAFQASSMQDAADVFGWYLDRPVLDRTGLKGDYDFTIEVEVDPTPPAPPAVDKTSGLGGNFFNPFSGITGPALSVALQTAGLRLESTKAPMDVLVIDHVEHPSEN